ncbi:MAG TPA: hypothetical protein V6C88_09205 [Chroococcidiopsis sp.]
MRSATLAQALLLTAAPSAAHTVSESEMSEPGMSEPGMSESGASPPGMRVCPVCKVKIIPIIGGDRVLFSAGPPGTRLTLWSKVCRHAQNPACINQNPPRA